MANISRSLNNPFVALKLKNFRLYWLGMCVSLIGTWMQNIAQPWLAYSLTDSPLLLSLVGTLQFLPMLLFSLFAGVYIDRFPKKKLLLFTQSASLFITLILTILVWSGNVRYWHILAASAALGIVNTLDMPTRQAFVVELVGKEHLMNAIALNSTVFNIARVLGPALAGVMMSFAGVAACFAINSVSFLAVIVSLFFIKPLAQPILKSEKKVWASIKEGLDYVRQTPALLKTLVSILIVGTFAMNYNVLVPVFARVVLNQQETGFGFLMSFVGIGSFFGAMFIAAISGKGPNAFVLKFFPVFIAVLLTLTGLTASFFLTAFGLAATGFCFVAFTSSANSNLQLTTQNEYRGRVMSVYTWVFGGSTPIGNLFAGAIAENFGPAPGFVACGVMILLPVLLLMLWRVNRKRKNGASPER